MSLFGALPIAGSGIDAMQTWIDTTGGNLANIDDVAPTGSATYAAQTPILSAVDPGIPGAVAPGQGVAVSAIELGSTAGVVESDPQSPLADAQGDVRVPDISMSDQLVTLIEAQQGYQADTDVISQAKSAYQAGLTIGS
ncbi:MAG TPA: flagellar basal body rod C-terminal domain-containing protein [Acidimicrobiales bacterium]